MTHLSQTALLFEENVGQTDSAVRFHVRGLGGNVFFTSDEVVLALPNRNESAAFKAAQATDLFNHADPQYAHPQSLAPSTVRLRFEGANAHPTIAPAEKLPGVVNYFYGSDTNAWHANIATYGGIVYKELYPGIDLRYDGTDQHLKGTYIVAPNADPSRIRWRYAEASHVEIATNGDLRVGLQRPAASAGQPTAENVLVEAAPVVWQEIAGQRVSIQVSYTRNTDDTYSFALGSYDHTHPLIIDPTFSYSTLLGGTGDDIGKGIAVDDAGNIYITGYTTSTSFPEGGSAVRNYTQNQDAFVAKLNPSGDTVLFYTYLGSSGIDDGAGIAVNATGVYVVGTTASGTTTFPTTTGAKQQTYGGGGSDAFVTKLTSSGGLSYSTFLGGSDSDQGNAIAIDSIGNAYITGRGGDAFPLKNEITSQTPAVGFGTTTIILTKIKPDGSDLIYSTFIGNGGYGYGTGIALDASNNAVIIGQTNSPSYSAPFNNPVRTAKGSREGFITKINYAGTTLSPNYFSFLGGAADDLLRAVATDSAGNAYVTGATNSATSQTDPFPLVNPAQLPSSSSAAFVTKFDNTGTITYSTLLGGGSSGAVELNDNGMGIVVDSANRAIVTGYSYSNPGAIPFINALPVQSSYQGDYDAFVTQIDPSGKPFLFSTVLGGSGNDGADAIALDKQGSVYITGNTSPGTASPFPTTPNGLRRTPYTTNGNDAFVVKISGVGSKVDTQPPSIPQNARITATTNSTISLTWDASTDNIGVVAYNIYNGQAVVGSSNSTSFTVGALALGKTYGFTVTALDAAGWESSYSNQVIGSTTFSTTLPTTSVGAMLFVGGYGTQAACDPSGTGCRPQVANQLDLGGNWTYPAQAPNFDGKVTQLLFGANANLYATTAGGSLWSTTNNQTWAQVYSPIGLQREYVQNNQAKLVQIAVVGDGRRIYSGVNSTFTNPGPSSGLWRSDDGGFSFTSLYTLAPTVDGTPRVTSIAVSPLDERVIWLASTIDKECSDPNGSGATTPRACAGADVRVSTDGGQTFTVIYSPIGKVQDIKLYADPTRRDRVYATVQRVTNPNNSPTSLGYIQKITGFNTSDASFSTSMFAPYGLCLATAVTGTTCAEYSGFQNIVIDPGQPKTAWIADGSVHTTTNADVDSPTWSDDTVAVGGTAVGNIHTVHLAYEGTLFVGTEDPNQLSAPTTSSVLYRAGAGRGMFRSARVSAFGNYLPVGTGTPPTAAAFATPAANPNGAGYTRKADGFIRVGVIGEQFSSQMVNANNGNYVATATDLSQASPPEAPGMGLSFGRTYNSFLNDRAGDASIESSRDDGGFGRGWRHSYEWFASAYTDGNSGQVYQVVVRRPDGREDIFSPNSTSGGVTTYTTDSATDSSLTTIGSGTNTVITLTELDKTVVTFDDPAKGRVRKIVDRYGNTIHFWYDGEDSQTKTTISLCLGSAQITTRSDKCNGQKPAQQLTLNYGTFTGTFGTLRQITQVIDDQSRAVSYDYTDTNDKNRLTVVRDPRYAQTQKQTQYSYWNNSSQLKQATDPLGMILINLNYNSGGRVSTAGDGQTTELKISFTYSVNDGATSTLFKDKNSLSSYTKVTDQRCALSYFSSDSKGRLQYAAASTSVPANPPADCSTVALPANNTFILDRVDTDKRGHTQVHEIQHYDTTIQMQMVDRKEYSLYKDNGLLSDAITGVRSANVAGLPFTQWLIGSHTEYNAANQPTTVATGLYDSGCQITSYPSTSATGCTLLGSQSHTVTMVYDVSGNILQETRQPATANTVNGTAVTVINKVSYTYDGANQHPYRLKTATTTTDQAGSNTLVAQYLYDTSAPYGFQNGFAVEFDKTFIGVTPSTALPQATTQTPATSRTIVQKMAYNSVGQLIDLFDPYYQGDPATTTKLHYGYDPDGHLTSIVNQLNQTGSNVYDAAERVTSYSSYLGQVTNYAYTPLNQLQTVVKVLGSPAPAYAPCSGGAATTNSVSCYSYDKTGNLETAKAKVEGSSGGVDTTTTYIHDGLGRLISTQLPLQASGAVMQTDNVYDAADNLVQITRKNKKADGTAADQITAHEYDELGRILSQTRPDAGKTVNVYDPFGNLTEVRQSIANWQGVTNWTDKTKAVTTKHVYDTLNREIETRVDGYNPLDAANTGTLEYITSTAYDDTQNLIVVADPYGSKLTTRKDMAGRPLYTKRTASQAAGVVAGAQSETVSYSFYDAYNLLRRTIDPENHVTDTAYDILQRTIEKASYTDLNANGGGTRLATKTVYVDTTQPEVRTFAPTDNTTGGQTQVAVSVLDEIGRTIRATTYTATATYPNLPSSTAALTTNYTYDPSGNKISEDLPDDGGSLPVMVRQPTLFKYENAGWLTEVRQKVTSGGTAQDPITKYTYDLMGNRLSLIDAKTHTSKAAFDQMNRLQQEFDALGNNAYYEYDALSRMTTRRDMKNQLTTFDYDNVGRTDAFDQL